MATADIKDLIVASLNIDTSSLNKMLKDISKQSQTLTEKLELVDIKLANFEEHTEKIKECERKLEAQSRVNDDLTETMMNTRNLISERELKFLKIEERQKEQQKTIQELTALLKEISTKELNVQAAAALLNVPTRNDDRVKTKVTFPEESGSVDKDKSSDSIKDKKNVFERKEKRGMTQMSLQFTSSKSLLKVTDPTELDDISMLKTQFSQINRNFDKINKIMEESQRNMKVIN